jgi:DeoR family fructose operon transcriptional repressor
MIDQPQGEGTRLLPAQRQLKLTRLLAGADAVSLDMLAREFGVSTQTIRRDLIQLEQQGLVRRTYGGAVTREALELSEPAFVARERTHGAEKRAIAQVALTSLRRGESVFLDASTTVLALARLIPDDWTGEIVVTSLPAAMVVSRRPGVRLTVVGGEFRHSSRSFGGPLAQEMLRSLCVTTAYISARGVHPKRGLTEAHAGEAALKRIILANAERVIGLVDSSKLGKTASHRVAPVSALDLLITDSGAAASCINELRSLGVQVVIAGSPHPE